MFQCLAASRIAGLWALTCIKMARFHCEDIVFKASETPLSKDHLTFSHRLILRYSIYQNIIVHIESHPKHLNPQTCLPSPPATAPQSSTRTGAPAPAPSSSSPTAGPSPPTTGRRKCSSSAPKATAALPTTVGATAAQASLGTATTWTPTLTICISSSSTST